MTRVLKAVRRDGTTQLIFRVRGFYGVLDPKEPHQVVETVQNYTNLTAYVRRLIPKNDLFPHEISEEMSRNESVKTT